jgi:hypothetical protein
MINTEKLDIYLPQIDDRSEEELVQRAYNIVAQVSNNTLNDFTDGDPLGVLIRAQAFAAAEFLYRVNKLPLSLLISFLGIVGIERKLESFAKVNLTFTLTAPRQTPYQIPKAFEVSSQNGQFRFFTDGVLTIPAGNLTGSVTATAFEPGAAYNIPAYTLISVKQPLAFLAGVTNLTSASGGSNAETIEEALNRGLAELRKKNLVSAVDFEQQAELVMGAGSKAKAVGLLGPDKVTTTPGSIHLFCLDNTKNPAGVGVTTAVRNALTPNLTLGTTLYISPMEVQDVAVKIYGRIDNSITAETVADNLWDIYTSYLSTSNFNSGETVFIEEVRQQLRFSSGINFIDYILLNGEPLNVQMPNVYTIAFPTSLVAELSDGQGNTFTVARGSLDDV